MTNEFIAHVMERVLYRIESLREINTTCGGVIKTLVVDEGMNFDACEEWSNDIMKRFRDFLEGEPQLLKTCLPQAFKNGRLHPGESWWKYQKVDPDRVACIKAFINELKK